jgi:hypothetical protein
MKNQILTKCIAELNKDKPNLDYVRGILETLVDLDTTASPVNYMAPTRGIPASNAVASVEEEYSPAYELGPIAPLH